MTHENDKESGKFYQGFAVMARFNSYSPHARLLSTFAKDASDVDCPVELVNSPAFARDFSVEKGSVLPFNTN